MKRQLVALALFSPMMQSCVSTAEKLHVPVVSPETPIKLIWQQSSGFMPTETTLENKQTIERFLEFVRTHNDGWKEPWGTFPTPQYSIFVKRGDELLLVVWLGPNWIGGRESNQGASSNRLRNLTVKEQDELHSILGIIKN